jgi:hypothetical protein
MHNDESLIPPLSVIQDRLSRNQRERSLLRALFRLAIRATKNQPSHDVHEPRHEAEGRRVSS